MINRLVASVRVALRVDLAKLRLAERIHVTVPVTLCLVGGVLTGQIDIAVSMAIGAFLCGIADVGDSYPIRARVMIIASVALATAALTSASLATFPWLLIFGSGAFAFVCGYAASLGTNAATTGTLALVVFTLYSGGEVSEQAVVMQGLAVLAGAGIETAFALAGWPTRRAAAIRGQIADVWREYAVRSGGDPDLMLAATLPGILVHCATEIRSCGATGATLRWLQRLIGDAEALRLPMASLASKRMHLSAVPDNDPEVRAINDFCRRVGTFSRAVSRTLVIPAKRTQVSVALFQVEEVAARASRYAPAEVEQIMRILRSVAREMAEPMPIGRRAQMHFRIDAGDLDWRQALASCWNWRSPVLRHSIRMAVAIPVALMVGNLVLSAHQYWVALTVAWVARPGYGTTFGRVVSRTGGTLLGLAVVIVLIGFFNPGPWWMVVVCTFAAYVMFATIPVNYAFAVVFITVLIVTMLQLDGGDLESSLWNRAIGTVLGGIIALIAAQFGASWASPTLASKLELVAAQARRYVQAGSDASAASLTLLEARRSVSEAIDEASLESPRGTLSAQRAQRVLSSLLAGVFVVAMTCGSDSSNARTDSTDPDITDLEITDLGSISTDSTNTELTNAEPVSTVDVDRFSQELLRLEQLLAQVDAGSRVPPPDPAVPISVANPLVDPSADPATQAIMRACAYL